MYNHVSVLPHEVQALFSGFTAGTIVDATLGSGGHSASLLSSLPPEVRVLGLDRDPAAIAAASKTLAPYADRCRTVLAPFSSLSQHLNPEVDHPVVGVLADLGVSSHQIDTPDRGFSLQHTGPLDMRMGPDAPLTAAQLLDQTPERELARLLAVYGEIHNPAALARDIKTAWSKGLIKNTTDLADRIRFPHARGRTGMVAQVFQALRIVVNDELGQLSRLLETVHAVLAPGGRVVILSFHSLEDRTVKTAFSSWVGQGTFRAITDSAVKASGSEIDVNNRSRSVRLRCVERC